MENIRERSGIYLRTGRTDMRKSINSLAVLVQEEMKLNPFEESLFMFSNGRRTLKILYWDKNGFCLWMKRLETNKFPWPKNSGQVLNLTKEQLGWLLSGIDFFHAHETLNYTAVG